MIRMTLAALALLAPMAALAHDMHGTAITPHVHVPQVPTPVVAICDPAAAPCPMLPAQN